MQEPKCSGCGGGGPLHVHLVVPGHAGGADLPSNKVNLCRACIFSLGMPRRGGTKKDRPVSLHVGRGLYDRLQGSLTGEGGYSSMSKLVNDLVRFYLEQGGIEELEFFQDDGARDVRMTVWLPDDVYHPFKVSAVEARATVTERLISLLMWYLERVNQRLTLNDVDEAGEDALEGVG